MEHNLYQLAKMSSAWWLRWLMYELLAIWMLTKLMLNLFLLAFNKNYESYKIIGLLLK